MASYTILQSVEIRGCIVNFQASCLDNRVTAYKSGIKKFKSPNDAGIQVTLRNSDEFIKRTDQHVTFDVHSTESISGFSYVGRLPTRVSHVCLTFCVCWEEVNPRPRRNRRGPDVRTTQLIEHAADTGTSNINNTDNFEPPPTNDPGLNEQAPENTGPPDVWHSRLQSRSHTTCGDQSTQPWTIVLSRKRRQRRKDRARRNDPADSDEEPPEARLRIAASRLRARNTDPTRT
ncbi:hypothetical protein CAPTEDRAFT_201274 [Capitella teleta]|uniref:Uncharacterized protein n=1 Tax=Capitella teleta TaxID=283909 RepID=R7VH36_CAPTE|nr:hypothetical protein CAPTEDRAFT_201274 [Capitella teleta]|eukprot:ELU15611.1 hypothetical protein CAPTEDRAFT_201274 [Capitella teleta]